MFTCLSNRAEMVGGGVREIFRVKDLPHCKNGDFQSIFACNAPAGTQKKIIEKSSNYD